MRPLVLFCLMSLLVCVPAYADTILGTTTGCVCAEPVIESTQALAQQFTLTSTVTLSSIDLGLNQGLGTAPIVLQLTNALGSGTTSANVVFQSSIPSTVVPTTIGSILNVATPITLGPGTYYLVLSTSDNFGYDWQLASSTLASTVGTVGSSMYCCFPNTVGSFAPAETFKNLTGEPAPYFMFDLQTASAPSVPEPSVLLLLLPSLSLFFARRRV
jgi:hypothetical protein